MCNEIQLTKTNMKDGKLTLAFQSAKLRIGNFVSNLNLKTALFILKNIYISAIWLIIAFLLMQLDLATKDAVFKELEVVHGQRAADIEQLEKIYSDKDGKLTLPKSELDLATLEAKFAADIAKKEALKSDKEKREKRMNIAAKKTLKVGNINANANGGQVVELQKAEESQYKYIDELETKDGKHKHLDAALEAQKNIVPSFYVSPIFNFVQVYNTGVSFSLMEDIPFAKQVISALTIVIVAGLCVALVIVKPAMLRAAITLIIGGAMGNISDRLTFGGVRDFLDFHIGAYHWPAFNLADTLVFIGMCMIIIYDIFLKNNQNEPQNDKQNHN